MAITHATAADSSFSSAGVAAWNEAHAIGAGTITTVELGGDITTAGKALLDDASAAAQRTTLGLGTAATTAAADYATAAQGAKADSALQANPDIGAATGTSLSLSGMLNLANTGGAATAGQLTLIAGTLTVNTTAATATCLIFFQRVTAGGTIGFATTYTVVANTSFTLSSDSALDTSVYNWMIVETH